MKTKINEEYQKLIDKLKDVKCGTMLASDVESLESVIDSLEDLGTRPIIPNDEEQFMSIAQDIAKNLDYNTDFKESLEEFGLVASVIRLGDKMNKIKSLIKKEAHVQDESIKDTLLDIANHAIMTVMWMNKHQNV